MFITVYGFYNLLEPCLDVTAVLPFLKMITRIKTTTSKMSKAVAQMCSVKKAFLEISQN